MSSDKPVRLNREHHELVEANLGLADRIASIKSRKIPHLSFDDAQSAAYRGLCDAARKFDAKRGFKFSTYASTRIAGEVIDYIRNINGRRGQKQLVQMEVTEEIDSGERRTEHSLLAVRDTISEVNEFWEHAVRGFGAINKWVILAYFRDGLTMKEIGESRGLSESRVSQLMTELKIRLRKNFTECKQQKRAAGDRPDQTIGFHFHNRVNTVAASPAVMPRKTSNFTSASRSRLVFSNPKGLILMETKMRALDIVRSLDADEIESQIEETEHELVALRKLLEVATAGEGKPKARKPGTPSGQLTEGQLKVVEQIKMALISGPLTFAELMEKADLPRGVILRPLGNGPFRKLPDGRWELIASSSHCETSEAVA